MKKTLLAVGLALTLGGGYSLSAFAQAKPEALAKQREAAMTLMSKYFGPLGLMNAGKMPFNAEVVKRNAGYLDVLTQMPWDGFDESTKDVKSRAQPAVYSNAAGFKTAQGKLRAGVGKLVAANGDEAGSKAAIKEIAGACGGCHKTFRMK